MRTSVTGSPRRTAPATRCPISPAARGDHAGRDGLDSAYRPPVAGPPPPAPSRPPGPGRPRPPRPSEPPARPPAPVDAVPPRAQLPPAVGPRPAPAAATRRASGPEPRQGHPPPPTPPRGRVGVGPLDASEVRIRVGGFVGGHPPSVRQPGHHRPARPPTDQVRTRPGAGRITRDAGPIAEGRHGLRPHRELQSTIRRQPFAATAMSRRCGRPDPRRAALHDRGLPRSRSGPHSHSTTQHRYRAETPRPQPRPREAPTARQSDARRAEGRLKSARLRVPWPVGAGPRKVRPREVRPRGVRPRGVRPRGAPPTDRRLLEVRSAEAPADEAGPAAEAHPAEPRPRQAVRARRGCGRRRSRSSPARR